MLVYHYHPDTGVYLNVATEADEDPLDPGHYLVPAHTTERTPPFATEKQQAVFRDDGWVVEPKPVPPALKRHVATAPEGGLFHNVTVKEALKGGTS